MEMFVEETTFDINMKNNKRRPKVSNEEWFCKIHTLDINS